MPIPAARLHAANSAPLRPERDFVLYWMIATRRVSWSFALDHALDRARELGKPLLVFEPLRVGYRWASDRHHAFIIQGMAANRAAFAGSPVGYFPYVEPGPGQGSGLLQALAGQACVVITDDWPGFFLPRMVLAAATRLDVRLEAVDSAGLYPFRAAPRTFHRAVDFRRHLQANLAPHLSTWPAAEPVAGCDLPRFPGLPAAIRSRWPAADPSQVDLATLPIDHAVPPVSDQGGTPAAVARWRSFLEHRLDRYDQRNHPDDDVASGLSPWLHFGHVGVHRLWADLVSRHGWTPDHLAPRARGSRQGWWGLPPATEAFLDELVTWRELGFSFCHRQPDYGRYDSLPDWARQTLAEHAADLRPVRYDLDDLDQARTHDELWNAAQHQLRAEGRIHSYLRMLWGKKVLHWSESPQQAWEILVELNNRYATDGRDPNSWSGIGWVFGRFDRAWGPERPIFGKVRYMTSDSTRRKLRLGEYLVQWGP